MRSEDIGSDSTPAMPSGSEPIAHAHACVHPRTRTRTRARGEVAMASTMAEQELLYLQHELRLERQAHRQTADFLQRTLREAQRYQTQASRLSVQIETMTGPPPGPDLDPDPDPAEPDSDPAPPMLGAGPAGAGGGVPPGGAGEDVQIRLFAILGCLARLGQALSADDHLVSPLEARTLLGQAHHHLDALGHQLGLTTPTPRRDPEAYGTGRPGS